MARARLENGERQRVSGQQAPPLPETRPTSRVDSKTFVQSLARGIQVLECLNVHNGSSVNALARLTGINRAIVYRLAETLRYLGLIDRDKASGTYWLQNPVTGLANGYVSEGWIGSKVPEVLEDLGRKVLWPLSFSVPSEGAMVLRFCTDHQNPFALRRKPIGYRMSIPGTASGRVYLAACGMDLRDQLLRVVCESASFPGDEAARHRRRFLAALDRIRADGYDYQDYDPVRTLAVPVMREGSSAGALCLRYYASALKPQTALRQYLDPLLQTADLLSRIPLNAAPPS